MPMELEFDSDMLMAPGKSRPANAPPSEGSSQGTTDPATGKELFAWAKRETHRAGVDLVKRVKDWGRSHRCHADIFQWTASQVVACYTDIGPGPRPASPPPPSSSVRSDSTPVASPRPLRSVPQPATGAALLSWARDASASLGLDIAGMVRDWGERKLLLPDVRSWDIGNVTDCLADLAKELDRRKLLDIPPEARAQMPQPREEVTPEPGPMELDPRDRNFQRKDEIKRTLWKLYKLAFGITRESAPQVTQDDLLQFLRTRCREHQIVEPNDLRNIPSQEHLGAILKALREDYEDSRRLS